MLIRILADNPGKTFTRNVDEKFVTTVQNLLRNGRDPSVKQILMETLDTFARQKANDEGLAHLNAMWKQEHERMIQIHVCYQAFVASAHLLIVHRDLVLDGNNLDLTRDHRITFRETTQTDAYRILKNSRHASRKRERPRNYCLKLSSQLHLPNYSKMSLSGSSQIAVSQLVAVYKHTWSRRIRHLTMILWRR